MDNVLRGGYPMQLGNNKIFYVYSRKHGDLERDYNYFPCCRNSIRRETGTSAMSIRTAAATPFAPFVGRKNIQEFYSLIQLDGYNPLGVEKLTYRLSKERAKKLLTDVKEEQRSALIDFVTKPFTPGALCRKFGEVFSDTWDETLFIRVIDFAGGDGERIVRGRLLERSLDLQSRSDSGLPFCVPGAGEGNAL